MIKGEYIITYKQIQRQTRWKHENNDIKTQEKYNKNKIKVIQHGH